jgi:hypothetical protein
LTLRSDFCYSATLHAGSWEMVTKACPGRNNYPPAFLLDALAEGAYKPIHQALALTTR